MRALFIQAKPYFDNDLPLEHLIVRNRATGFYDFKPLHVMDGFGCLGNRPFNRIFDTGVRRARQFDLFVDMVFHGGFLSRLIFCAK